MENIEVQDSLFLTSDEVLRILRVSNRTLQNYRTEGKLLYYKMSPKTIRYKRTDVENFLKESSCCSYNKDNYKKLIEKYVVRM